MRHTAYLVSKNRHCLVVAVHIGEANGRAKCEGALRMLGHMGRCRVMEPRTLGMDAGYDAGDFLLELESRVIEPHVPVGRGEGRGLAGADAQDPLGLPNEPASR